MYLDLQNNHPEEPRVPRAISVREGVLLSLVAHLVAVLVWVLMPKHAPVPVVVEPVDPVKFVQLTPLAPQPTPQAMTRERAPQPENTAPLVRGTTPEKVLGAPEVKPAGPPTPDPTPAVQPPAPPTTTASATTPPDTLTPPEPPPAPKGGGGLRESLQNLSKYLRAESFDNPKGGQSNYGSDIKFDDKGVDFGPWLARFKAQIERNWRPPDALLKGHVVFQFWVLKNGTIIGVQMVEPSTIESYNVSAMAALKLSNPTMKLPEEYPTDRVLFTVTFHYNEGVHDPR
jgi:TonB family protein